MTNVGPLFVTGNPASPVAICTLSSHDLLQRIAESPLLEQVAMVGPLETQNLGIERMLRSLLGAPTLRWLVLCGQESRARRQADAVRCLFAHGVDADGAILGARSRRARLPLLRAEEVDAVRGRVRLRDLVGEQRLDRIRAVVEECLAQPLEPPPAGPEAQRAGSEAEQLIAVPRRRVRPAALDPAGFLVVLIDRPAQRLIAEHYGTDGILRHRLAGEDADSLSQALVEWGLVSQLDHAAYIGRELARAEAALKLGLPYRQDEPFPPPQEPS